MGRISSVKEGKGTKILGKKIKMNNGGGEEYQVVVSFIHHCLVPLNWTNPDICLGGGLCAEVPDLVQDRGHQEHHRRQEDTARDADVRETQGCKYSCLVLISSVG